jgi:hypothetical protein
MGAEIYWIINLGTSLFLNKFTREHNIFEAFAPDDVKLNSAVHGLEVYGSVSETPQGENDVNPPPHRSSEVRGLILHKDI